MWAWLWNQAVSFEKNFSRSLNCLEENVHRSLLGFDKAVGEDSKDVNKCYWKLEEGRFLLWRARTLATLGPAVTGKVENVPHPLEVLRVPACL